jgi:hypothetical protein
MSETMAKIRGILWPYGAIQPTKWRDDDLIVGQRSEKAGTKSTFSPYTFGASEDSDNRSRRFSETDYLLFSECWELAAGVFDRFAGVLKQVGEKRFRGGYRSLNDFAVFPIVFPFTGLPERGSTRRADSFRNSHPVPGLSLLIGRCALPSVGASGTAR